MIKTKKKLLENLYHNLKISKHNNNKYIKLENEVF